MIVSTAETTINMGEMRISVLKLIISETKSSNSASKHIVMEWKMTVIVLMQIIFVTKQISNETKQVCFFDQTR